MKRPTKAERDAATSARMLAHPIRRRILRRLEEAKFASPAELGRELELPVATVSYHMRVLRSNGAVKQVKTRRVRGATEHFFRSTGKVSLRSDAETALDRITEVVDVREGETDVMIEAVRDILAETGRGTR
jgi:DNA-binding transcriptional ArsR family regulator